MVVSMFSILRQFDASTQGTIMFLLFIGPIAWAEARFSKGEK